MYLTDKMAVCEFLEVKEMMNLKSTCVFENESAHLVTDKMIRKQFALDSERCCNDNTPREYKGYPFPWSERCPLFLWISIQKRLFMFNNNINETNEDWLLAWETRYDKYRPRISDYPVWTTILGVDNNVHTATRPGYYIEFIHLKFMKYIKTDAGKKEVFAPTSSNAEMIKKYSDLYSGFDSL